MFEVYLLVLLVTAGPVPLAAQASAARGAWEEATAGDEVEMYLRALQIAGEIPRYPWTVRGFSPLELRLLAPRDSLHPWARRFAPVLDSRLGPQVAVLRTDARIIGNTAFPFGVNDGPVWAGRGVTGSVSIGVLARAGPVTLAVRPIAFWAQNAAFDLKDNGQSGRLRFADPWMPGAVDAPQRFGDAPYARLDAGESMLRLDAGPLAVGVSTASEIWGPAIANPLVLGNNAGGFPHVFVGTSRPLDLFVGEVHARVILGRLDHSAYGVYRPDTARREGVGAVFSFVPRGLPGLEIGVTRFTHKLSESLRFGDIVEPFGLVFDPVGDPTNNELASFFGRWALPAGGLEVYGEFMRDDRAGDRRDFLLEPDHYSVYMLGLHKVWRAADARRLVALRTEIVNARVTHLSRIRGESRVYVHDPIVQGHTQRGQILASVAAFGGGGSALGVDVYDPRGRLSFTWDRLLENGSLAEAQPLGGIDVQHVLGAELVRFRGGVDFTVGVRAVVELNRSARSDAINLNVRLGARLPLGASRGGTADGRRGRVAAPEGPVRVPREPLPRDSVRSAPDTMSRRAPAAQPRARDSTAAAAPTAPPPLPASPARPAPRPPGAAPPGATDRPLATARTYAVQVGAFRRRAEAAAQVGRLLGRGFPARIVGAAAPYRVQVGAYATRARATAVARALRRSGYADAWIVER